MSVSSIFSIVIIAADNKPELHQCSTYVDEEWPCSKMPYIDEKLILGIIKLYFFNT